MRLTSRLGKLIISVVTVVLAVAAVASLIELKGRRSDRLARAAADDNTKIYWHSFAFGESQSNVEETLASLRLNTLHRGNDEVLIIAKEGRSVWYCSHNFFGTALTFANGKLSQVKSDEWLETCL